MGLLDILNGMQAGPRGGRQSSPGGGGMSPISMALLGLLAYKAVKSFGGAKPAASPPAQAPTGSAGGGLGDVLGRLFGGSSDADAAARSASPILPSWPGTRSTSVRRRAASASVASRRARPM